jgi:hypothetical protein
MINDVEVAHFEVFTAMVVQALVSLAVPPYVLSEVTYASEERELSSLGLKRDTERERECVHVCVG